MNCLGVPVEYDPNLQSVSITLVNRWWWPWKFMTAPGLIQTQGILWWKKIVIGRAFNAFPEREREAILLHEVAHAKLLHIEKRILAAWQIVFAPRAFVQLCVTQEFQADWFAAECNRGIELASALSRMKTDARASLHPAVDERVARLVAWRSKV
jgi:Zn-dependent protease with chaperone function